MKYEIYDNTNIQLLWMDCALTDSECALRLKTHSDHLRIVDQMNTCTAHFSG